MDPTRTTTRDIRRQNRSVLLSKLFFDGPLSRLELGQLTGLSSATVSTVTGELIDDRLVVEAGQVESGGGRPRVLLRVDPGYGYVIGVDVGETGVYIELFDLAMVRRGAVMRPATSARPTPAEVVAEITAGIATVLAAPDNRIPDNHFRDAATPDSTGGDDRTPGAAAAVPPAGPIDAGMVDAGPIDAGMVVGIGIGVPGIVEHTGPPEQADAVTVHAPTIGWQAVPLVDMLRAAGVTAPVLVGNGAKTQARAEMWFGAARGVRHAVVALVGSGVGAAVITDGVPYQGASSSAGEWGHTTLVYGGRDCRCGARGCIEAYVGAEGILDRYALARGKPAVGATDGAGEKELIAALIEASAGDPVAGELLDETAALLGAGIGNLVNLFNPERVVLGGWAGLALGAVALPRIRAAAAAQALAQPYAHVSIELSELGADAVAFGAATLPLAALLSRGEDPRTS